MSKGFTLVEVLIAAGLLGAFAVVAARPIQQGIAAVTTAADRAAGVHYAAAGLEWGRACTYSDYTSTPGSPSGTHTFVDATRGITFKRTLTKSAIEKDGYNRWVLWRVTAEVRPLLSSFYSQVPPREVRRLPGSKDVKVVTYQCRWLMPPDN